MKFAAVFLALVWLPGCFSWSWTREEIELPIIEESLAQLEYGASLDECLEQLGAPLYLWEYRKTGIALAWGSLSRRDLGLSVSVPISDQASGSINYNHIDNDIQGVVLVFDEDYRLRWIRRGFLSDLAQETRGLAAVVDD